MSHRGESQLDRAIHVGNLASIVSYIEMRFGIFYISKGDTKPVQSNKENQIMLHPRSATLNRGGGSRLGLRWCASSLDVPQLPLDHGLSQVTALSDIVGVL